MDKKRVVCMGGLEIGMYVDETHSRSQLGMRHGSVAATSLNELIACLEPLCLHGRLELGMCVCLRRRDAFTIQKWPKTWLSWHPDIGYVYDLFERADCSPRLASDTSSSVFIESQGCVCLGFL